MLLPARLRIFVVALSAALSLSSPAAPASKPWPADAFKPLTLARIAELPEGERSAWTEYWEASERLAAQLPTRAKADVSPLSRSGPPVGGARTKGLRMDASRDWYASEEARQTADRVVAAQTAVGGWAKGNDYHREPAPGETTTAGGPTFDNFATISELRYLGRVLAATGMGEEARSAAWAAGFERGLHYLFAAQYPNGGFPQCFPLIGGYHDGITFNDDAMTNVLELLRDVAEPQAAFAFVPQPLRDTCAARLRRGVACILATQLKQPDGRRTGWCQQYDALTQRPSAARNFEPIADASRESAGIVLLLMSLPQPSPEIVAAVEGAIAWFHDTALRDLKIRRAPADTRGEAVPASGAPPLWARFYEPGTTTPIFGDRDRTIHYDLAEISAERVAGYGWYTDAPAKAIARYEKWKGAR